MKIHIQDIFLSSILFVGCDFCTPTDRSAACAGWDQTFRPTSKDAGPLFYVVDSGSSPPNSNSSYTSQTPVSQEPLIDAGIMVPNTPEILDAGEPDAGKPDRECNDNGKGKGKDCEEHGDD